MADRGTIQRYPTALLPILGMQSSGDTPTELENTVKGTIDLTHMYLRDRMRCAQIGQSPNAAGYWLQPLIPAGEQWLVYSISANITQAAATTGTYKLAALLASTFASLYVGFGAPSALVASGQTALGYWFDQPRLFRTGDTFGFVVEQYTGAGASSASSLVQYVPLSI